MNPRGVDPTQVGQLPRQVVNGAAQMALQGLI
jgi:hypothetical protein